ncbi:MAG: DUF4810 domain-containing protein [Bacteroidaceae bacterium]|nr:DUF4810 domain-containing protein [Bacteroidaceae bacterium]MCF0186450.1 DUF4810 domain-containing protein [Bacteroidaceae bacterium]
MKTTKALSLFALLLIFASCGSSQKELYSWKDYEKNSYAYTKNPSEQTEKELLNTYQKLLDNPGGARKVVPPGICAELGYIYYKKGDKNMAAKYLQQEIELYPESAKFIKRILDAVKQ